MMAGAKDKALPPRIAVLGGAAALMLLPLLVLRAIDSTAWEAGDLAFLAILMAGVAIAYELATKMPDRLAYRAGLAIALTAGLLDAWINLAVGIIGSEDNSANLIFYAVLAVPLAGAAIARLQPAGMARAMVATAAAQIVAFFVAMVGGVGFIGPVTVFFTALWLASAWLFRNAERSMARTA